MKKKSTKLIAVVMTLAMLMTCMAFPAAAFGAETTATVTVLMDMGVSGEFAVKTIEVSSNDYVGTGNTEGIVTIADVAIASGFAIADNIENGQYGLGFKSDFNSGSVGYYVNNASAWSLNDEVKTGDYATLFIHDSAPSWSDTYYFFDKFLYAVDEGQDLTITLNMAGYDESYAPITSPGIDRTVVLTDADGKTVEAATDANGKAVFKGLAAGTYTASIKSKGADDYFVMPWAQATVTAVKKENVPSPGNDDNSVKDAYKDIRKVSVTANGLKLTVDTTDEGTAAIRAIKKNNKKTVKVPAKVTIEGVKYDVTDINAKAFRNCNKATKVVVPASVTLIKKNAFVGMKKLKTIEFKTKKNSITMKKGAYNGVKKNVAAKVPKKMKKAQLNQFKKTMKKAGFKGTVKQFY